MAETIVFYVPKSMAASVAGVLAKMTFFGLPFLVFWLTGAFQWGPVWLMGLFCFVIGFMFMMKSDRWVAPMIGTQTTFVFTETQLTVTSSGGSATWALSELPSLRAYEVSADTAIKHLEIACPDGRRYDLFETWITSETAAAFDRVYHRYLPE